MSWITRVELPEGLGLEAREAFSDLASGIASRFSFLGMEDWAVELAAGVKVLGVEREFHDLTVKGRMNSTQQFYFAKKADAVSFGKLLSANVDGLMVKPPRKQAKRDWMKEWRKHYKTQTLSDGKSKLHVVPAWKKPPGKGVSVKIWPGQAFGTGTHPTTRLCLRLLLRSGFSGGKVLDFGAGTGVLVIAAAKLGKISGTAVESDPEALKQCGKNAKLNRVPLRLAKKIPAGQFDFVFANVLAPVLLQFRETLIAALKPGAPIVLSGLLASEVESFWGEFGAGLQRVETLVEGDWAAIFGKKP